MKRRLHNDKWIWKAVGCAAATYNFIDFYCAGNTGQRICWVSVILAERLPFSSGKTAGSGKIHDSVESYFTAQYQTTAIPAETYLNVVTEDWIAERLEEQITSEYQILNGAKLSYQLDMSDLEAALTQFFSDYAEEINYTKDSTYEQKLQETIDNAEAELTSQLDVYHFSTMRNANILSRLTGKQLYLWIACGVCGVVSLLLMGILMGLERNGEWGMLYFPGCALFINGVFLILPTAWVLATSYFSGLAIKVPAVYAAVTGFYIIVPVSDWLQELFWQCWAWLQLWAV